MDTHIRTRKRCSYSISIALMTLLLFTNTIHVIAETQIPEISLQKLQQDLAEHDLQFLTYILKVSLNLFL